MLGGSVDYEINIQCHNRLSAGNAIFFEATHHGTISVRTELACMSRGLEVARERVASLTDRCSPTGAIVFPIVVGDRPCERPPHRSQRALVVPRRGPLNAGAQLRPPRKAKRVARGAPILGCLYATSNAARRDADAFQRQRNFCDGHQERTGLPPRVRASKRTQGKDASRGLAVAIRSRGGSWPSLTRVRWLRRRSALNHCRVTWVRNAATASVLPGTA